jgi:hypothetical protein
MRKQEYLYVFSNPSMPGLLKIGCTKRHPLQRALELYSTGVPTPFELEFSCIVPNCSVSERQAHRALARYRITQQREFFRVSLKTALKEIIAVVGSASMGNSSKHPRNAARAKAARSVIAPAKWPLPKSSAPAGQSKQPVTGVEPNRKMKRKAPQSKTVIAPAAWPFPVASRP